MDGSTGAMLMIALAFVMVAIGVPEIAMLWLVIAMVVLVWDHG